MATAEALFEYFPKLSSRQREQYEALLPLYTEWNAQINVISRKDMDHFYERHVLHSMTIAHYISFKPGTQILDVGTGGGFPGIPLAIRFPQVQFLLIDSIGKKTKVVEAVVQNLDLKNVEVQQIRAEQVNRSFDFIVSRAVTRLETFVQWTRNKIHKKQINSLRNGILYLKGGDLEEELEAISKYYKHRVFPLAPDFKGEFFETKKLLHLVPIR
ncbi:MAG: 16S rRNA (guanine(527)-N(7))-methyltransferase RsmG [Bacteroidales bacterium]|jgi:16S rRNA (guanine527-N7)-methyltransferase|nr:16S rRNA (guanine(527)-N(7))-methyltransferase RsmG [Bacteroidales bacterium]